MPVAPVQISMKPYSIVAISRETPDVTMFRFAAQDKTKITFDPGMFVMIAHQDQATGTKVARAFSIASDPNDDYLEFFISMIHGKFTSHLDTAKVGDIYYVTGPYGQFKFIPSTDKKVLYLAGGTGLAPFMGMIRQIDDLKSGNDVAMIYSVRYPAEVIRKAELEELAKKVALKNFITVTRPQLGDGWTGLTGHINAEMIKKCCPDYLERAPYICGPLAFVKAIRDALISLGVQEAKIKADVWG